MKSRQKFPAGPVHFIMFGRSLPLPEYAHGSGTIHGADQRGDRGAVDVGMLTRTVDQVFPFPAAAQSDKRDGVGVGNLSRACFRRNPRA